MSLSADFLSDSDSDNERDYSYVRPTLARKKVQRNEKLEVSSFKEHGQLIYPTQDRDNLESPKLVLPVKARYNYDFEVLEKEQRMGRPEEVIDKTSTRETYALDEPHECLSDPSEGLPRIKSPKKGGQDLTFEYGTPVDGYRFVGSRTDYATFIRSTEPSSSTQSQACSEEDLSRDISFDQKSQSGKTLDISLYMNRDSAKLRIPVEGAPFLDDVKIESIEESRISRFLEKCAVHQEQVLRELLKQERIAWHPDKAQRSNDEAKSQNLIKVTRIFQAINSLWEKTQ
ncbi:uncharacterized protein LALA0_S12e00716g [Lachancea lanzarotensis]|uniref:LALA0S12e00716g1_1 n=1 Tax=Lachancea lanzarotensis TaxID=1245769 RepID=A0A0C7N9G1_9SACH|nr:uncharacterized protein LALA0_S12e00716g [Lachancea lanzarotensis]CEP64519.1 LALA0S12e00716g1_1 [Lachancea lanzarotensis]